MDKSKSPGIAIEEIRLIKSQITMGNPENEARYNLQLIQLDRSESEDGKYLNLFASFDLMHGMEKPLFSFTCSFVARYSRTDESNMTWSEFSDVMAVTHIIPYLREYISNMTTRLPAPVLMLNPINVHGLVSQYKANQKAAKKVEKQ